MLRPGPTARPPLPSSLSAEFAPEVDSPPLEGPIGLETFPPLAGPALGEPLPAEGDSTLRALDPLPPPRTRSLDHEPVDVKAKPKPDPNEPPPSPPRRRGLFRQWVEGPTPDRDRSTARLEFDDPATRTALRKELEQQARDAGGRQLRSVEVRLTDTEVVIRGRANNFLNRRALKKKLESLPGLAGVPSTVVVD